MLCVIVIIAIIVIVVIIVIVFVFEFVWFYMFLSFRPIWSSTVSRNLRGFSCGDRSLVGREKHNII